MIEDGHKDGHEDSQDYSYEMKIVMLMEHNYVVLDGQTPTRSS